jgi:uncharacterized protein YjbI with pentapeptide repeats
MPNPEHLKFFDRGKDRWNEWRKFSVRYAPDFRPDLCKVRRPGADLCGFDLSNVDLHGADLFEADLSKTDLMGANLTEAMISSASLCESNLSTAKLDSANLFRADLTKADLSQASFRSANLTEAELCGANLSFAKFDQAKLIKADLEQAILVSTSLRGADLTFSHVYGISAWDLDCQNAIQDDLVITRRDQNLITVDNIQIAQFLYLLINNVEIRNALDAITTKVVLILGRFSSEHKPMLDSIRVAMRKKNFIPVMIDFSAPSNRDISETVSIIAHLARFVIADLTDPHSVPLELQRIIPQLPSVPIQPMIREGCHEFGMFRDLMRYPWVREPFIYSSAESVTNAMLTEMITAIDKVRL